MLLLLLAGLLVPRTLETWKARPHPPGKLRATAVAAVTHMCFEPLSRNQVRNDCWTMFRTPSITREQQQLSADTPHLAIVIGAPAEHAAVCHQSQIVEATTRNGGNVDSAFDLHTTGRILASLRIIGLLVMTTD
jgi:hypothetical protein